jgi:hypothetical protein
MSDWDHFEDQDESEHLVLLLLQRKEVFLRKTDHQDSF